MSRKKNIENIYPLSPMQQGMVFHNLYAPDSAAYFIQIACTLRGELNIPAFKQAWQTVMERHPILRTAFHWQRRQEPFQVVYRRLKLPWQAQDWRTLPAADQRTQLDAFLRADRAQGFDLTRPPLMRLALLQTAEHHYHFIWSHHHVLMDGWSLSLILQEVAQLYEAACQDEAVFLPPPRPYSDYIGWLQSQDVSGAESFWRQTLAGFTAATPLGIGKTYANWPSKEEDFAKEETNLSAETTAVLQNLAQQHQITLSTLVQGAWALLLSRYSNETDVLFGTVVSGRPAHLTGVENMVGLFFNTLPARVQITPKDALLSWLKRFQAQQAELRQYEHTPLVQIQRWSDVPSGHPLFESIFVFENYPVDDSFQEWGESLSVGDVHFFSRTNYPLSLLSAPEPTLPLHITYDRRRFDQTSIQHMLGHFRTLLEAIATNPHRRLFEFPLLTPEQRRQQLFAWNDTQRPFPQDACFQKLFEAQVVRTPEATAVSWNQQQLSYRQLNSRANQLAASLQKQGAGPEVVVALLAHRSIDFLTAVIAIFKTGAAYLPLDPHHPVKRHRQILKESRSQLLLTTRLFIPTLTQAIEHLPGSPRIFDLEDLYQQTETAQNPPICSTPENLAYVIYTSGSTGIPKGAMVKQLGMINHLYAKFHDLTITASDVIAQNASQCFDISVWQFLAALLKGGRVHIISDEIALDPMRLLRELEREKITILETVPSLLRAIIEVVQRDRARFNLSALRWMIPTGEALPPELCRQWFGLYPHIPLVNAYGPTECSDDVTHHIITTPPAAGIANMPIGKPINNTYLYILDRYMEPVPVGVAGELYIGGTGVGRGYLNNPRKTAVTFIPNPFLKDEKEPASFCLYKTGDLVRYLPNGTIEFLGRIDFQVKVRGFRIELGEIEAALSLHPNIKQNLVMVREDALNHKQLVAYLIPTQAPAPTTSQLRQYLLETLPDYMVPAAFVPLDAFPLLSNGKINRKALPPPEEGRAGLEKAFVPPRSKLESYLASLWQDILDLEQTGIHDHFFELGGDSIKGAIFINRLQEKMAETIYVVSLFDAPNIADFAQYLSKHYPETISRLFGIDSLSALEYQKADEQIDATTVAQFRQIIPPLPARTTPAEPQNPTAVFILSPPRSGTTLLRVMLGGHPRLFAPPELDLLSFNTLAERKTAFSGRFTFWQEGTIRAIMQTQGWDVESARAFMENCENDDQTTQAFYRLLQEWVHPRQIVDKTSTYALDLEIVKRMETDFENARYIHLLRHPYDMIRSFEEVRLDQVFFRYPHPFSVRQLAELIWLVSHQNILTFLNQVPQHRQRRIQFEALVAQPEATMREICQFMGLDFHPDMLHLYQDKQQRMTDGIYQVSRMLGDIKFHQHQGINPEVAHRWQKREVEHFLSDISWQIAESLGYDRLADSPPESASADQPTFTAIERLPRDGRVSLPLSFAQQRLWFLDQLEGGSPFYNIHNAVRVRGPLDIPALERALNEIVKRHEVLRCRFTSAEGRPFLQITPTLSLSLPIIDLPKTPDTDRDVQIQALITAAAQQPFDLAQDTLLRTSLIRLNPDDYIMLLTMHHIVADGWSTAIFIRELTAFYQAFAYERPLSLSELPVQYADFAHWQRNWLRGKMLDNHLAYWKRQLGGRLPLLELPTDYPRPSVQTFQGALHTFTLPQDLTHSLKALSKQEGATLFMTLLATFKALLYRYTGQKDILIGTPIAGRHRAEIENLIGFFTNTLVIRTDLSGNLTFRQLLARVRCITLDAYAHQDVPFEKLVETLNPERDLSHNPLFQVMFVMQNAPVEEIALPNLSLEPLDTDAGSATFDLTLSMVETAVGLEAVIQYRTELFDAATIGRLAHHFGVLLTAVVANPDQLLHTLPLLTETEKRQLIIDWNNTQTPYPPEQCVHHLLEAQAERTPNAIAVICGEQQLTYAQLHRQANQLAHHLQSLGVGPDTIVGLCLPRSPAMIIATLATLKAGGAYLPIDPTYPPDRIRHMLTDAGAAILLTNTDDFQFSNDKLSPSIFQFSIVNLSDWQLTNQPTNPPTNQLSSHNLAYVTYTSGSTGLPKGVAISHQSLCNQLQWRQDTYKLTQEDRILQSASISFDISVWEIFGPLLAGAQLIIPPSDDLQGGDLAESITRHRITTLQIVPSLLRPLLETKEHENWSHLRRVLIGGEPLTYALQNRFLTHTKAALHHLYGATETTIDSIFQPCTHKETQQFTIPIGRPIANTQVYILDGELQPVPIGVPGELYIGGDGLARGY
ncbi:MAG: amino acid adenylation domain-containing protein, partial [Anaerolinea sp.]|nr:amino acid adenylation domain-containing protein [Anaerolinea sp.]